MDEDLDEESLTSNVPEYPSTSELEDRIEELSGRVEQLESSRSDGVTVVYALGMAIAVVLSWAKNASILWCIGHGLLSWVYVIYIAWTRR